MKKIVKLLTALALAAGLALPVCAAESPATGDMMIPVVIALAVAAVAIVAIVIYSLKSKKK